MTILRIGCLVGSLTCRPYSLAKLPARKKTDVWLAKIGEHYGNAMTVSPGNFYVGLAARTCTCLIHFIVFGIGMVCIFIMLNYGELVSRYTWVMMEILVPPEHLSLSDQCREIRRSRHGTPTCTSAKKLGMRSRRGPMKERTIS
jgi:hypothetical protein